MRFATSLVALALVAGATTAGAQNCLGIASFSRGPIRVDGGIGTGNDATTLSAGLSAGAPQGPFASIAVNRISVDSDGEDNSVTGFGIQGGWELNLQPAAARSTPPRFSVCPVVSFAQYKESDSFEGEEIEGTVRSITGGVSVGTSIASSTSIGLLPFATLSIVRQSASFEGFGLDESVSETGGALDLGLGLVFGQRFTVRPAVSIPMGFEGADAQFGVSLHYNFGGK
jgi:hypothetical protein